MFLLSYFSKLKGLVLEAARRWSGFQFHDRSNMLRFYDKPPATTMRQFSVAAGTAFFFACSLSQNDS